MLTQTFIHIPGFSRNREEQLWKSGIRTWDDFLERGHTLGLPESTRQYISRNLEISKEQLKKENHAFFSGNLPLNEHWRAYRDFSSTCFLDIETTGLCRVRNKITTIGIFDGKKSRVFVRHRDMDAFASEIGKYSTIITFNGRCFDIPFLREKFSGLRLSQLHIDLRFLLRELGYTGGLKNIEKQLGIARDGGIADVDGYEAVRLWHRYRRGDESALNTLIEYNKADVENLKLLMDMAYEKKLKSLPGAVQRDSLDSS